MIFYILDKWFSQNRFIWNRKHQKQAEDAEEDAEAKARRNLQNSEKQKRCLKQLT